MFRNLSVARKWRISILTVALLLSGVILYTLFGLLSASHDLTGLINGPHRQEQYSNQTRITILQLARDIRDLYIQTKGSNQSISEQQAKAKEYAIKIDGDKTQLYQQLTLLDDSYENPPALIGEYRQAVNTWIAIGDRIVQAIADGNDTHAADLILNDGPQALDTLTAIAKKIDQEAAEATAEASKHSLQGVWITSAVAAAAFIAAMLLTYLLSQKVRKSILPPLQEVQGLAEALSKGNLSYPVSFQSKDEFGHLADSLRESEQILSSYISEISRAMKELSRGNFDISTTQKFAGEFAEIETSITLFILTMSDLLRQVSQFAVQVSAGTEQVATGAQNLAQGTVEQAGSIQEIAANLGSAAEKITANAKDAASASKEANAAGRKISECRDKMDSMTHAMAEIESATEKISSIIHSIEEIAFQTNLLSLNAAVEAAHAGSAGKGFAVVAGEVRELAVKSAAASHSTAALIEQAISSVKKGSEIARDTAETLFSTVDHVSDTAEMLHGISTACAQQAELLTQVNLGVQQISVVVQNNSATAEESAAASEELASLARGLRALADRFHPKGG